ncbi:MAG TPA: hypothetical protein VGP46_01080, partial [Acidimicrobiales bacterium]|nr:hypothetical protein [Acidimicrobiales bacterium]
MARFRSAVDRAEALSAPARAPRHLSLLFLVALLAAGCSTTAVRDEPSTSSRVTPTTRDAGGKTTTSPGHKRPAGAKAPPHGSRSAVLRVWTDSKTQFYEAALHDEPDYAPFLRTLVPGGPVYVHSVAYLSGLVTEGLVGPSRWRVGNARLVSLTARRARVDGCLWDTGSLWKASHQPAPATLGGGSGFAASHAVLVLEGGKWLLL